MSVFPSGEGYGHSGEVLEPSLLPGVLSFLMISGLCFSIALKEALLGKQLLSVWEPVGEEAAETPEGILSKVFKTGTNLKGGR